MTSPSEAGSPWDAPSRGLMVVIAHPDDEVLTSGALCLCADAGLPIAIVAMTDGEGGGLELLAVGTRHDLARIRRAELAASAAAIGATAPTFLHQADVADPSDGAWDLPALANTLAGLIEELRPEAILTHGPQGGYGHPAHRLTHICVMDAARHARFPGAIFSFAARVRGAFFSWHLDQASDVRIDARSFLARRAASLDCHRSQADYFLQPYPPRSLRKHLSALFGRAFAFTETGRKRVPIGAPERFFARYPVEGLALQKAPDGGRPHLFKQHFSDDHRVQIDR